MQILWQHYALQQEYKTIILKNKAFASGFAAKAPARCQPCAAKRRTGTAGNARQEWSKMPFVRLCKEFCMKKALITGITGQDGSYLSEFLLEKGY